MKATLFQVDAFTRERFACHPAAVVALSGWPRDALLQAVAAENNLSETAFFVPATRGFELRWFTPSCEVDLCGHAILACAHVLFQYLSHERDRSVIGPVPARPRVVARALSRAMKVFRH